MEWTATELGLLATGLLFGGAIAAARATRAQLSRTTHGLFVGAAVVCIVTAVVLSWLPTIWYPPILWVLPAVPVLMIAVVVRDARRREQALATPSRAVPPRADSPRADAHRTDSLPAGGPSTGGSRAPEFSPGRTFSAHPAQPRWAPVRRVTVAPTDTHAMGSEVARARAHNPHTAASELADIAYAHPALRAAVAGNPATPAAVLEWLAKCGDPVVTTAISARGSSLPPRATTRQSTR